MVMMMMMMMMLMALLLLTYIDDGDGDVHNAGVVPKPASEDEEDAATEQGQGRESSRGEDRGEERKS